VFAMLCFKLADSPTALRCGARSYTRLNEFDQSD